MPAITGEGDLSGNTNSTLARLLSPDEVVGLLSGGFSLVDVCDVAVMSSAEILEGSIRVNATKSPSRIPSREDVLEPLRAILIFPSPSQHKWAAFLPPNEWPTPKESHPKSKIVIVKFDSRRNGEIQIVKCGYRHR